MTKKYIVFPINDSLPKKRFFLYGLVNGEEKLLYDFGASYDPDTPAVDAFLDITRFDGYETLLKDEEGKEIPFKTADRFPEMKEIRGGNFLRPKMHFTSKIGWLNDPNGMVYEDGKYHLFYQHNPVSRDWGNMTWGHAVSTDMLHWEEQGDKLFPDEMGDMFSGSAFIDRDNVAGFGKDAMLLYYTAAGNNSKINEAQWFTQCLAYSTDGGETFVKYSKNPIIPHIRVANRDPKVGYSAELGKYTLSLYTDESDFIIFVSDNLVDWEKFADVKMEQDNECPNFYPLYVDDKLKWVFQGAQDRYIIFSIKNGELVKEQDELPFHMGNISYAAQVFAGTLPRVIRIAWIQSTAPETVFNSQMGIPTEMFLKRVGDKIRLGALPVKETETTVKKVFAKEITDFSGKFSMVDTNSLCNSCIDVSAEIGEDCDDFTLSCFGGTVKISPKTNGYTHGDVTAPLSYSGNKNIRILFDTLSGEVFADGGLVYSTFRMTADRTKPVEIETSGKINLKITAKVMEL